MAITKWTMALAAILAADASAQWTYPSCSPATNADFAVTTVVNRANNDQSILEPLKMDFVLNADGTVDIYYIQRGGQFKRYDGKAKTVSTLGTVPVVTQNEDGLVGLALDPAFAQNRRVFLYYSHSSGFRLSRFTLDGTGGQLNTSSEKVLLTIPSARGMWHTSGALRFDAYGDLWVSVGDNQTTYMGPANTKDLRGSLLRIHPEEDGTYTIPQGNMWETVSAWFRANGKPDVADKYLDSTRMRREIYVKGTRNAYTLTLDPVRRWAVYGDCGPDQESSTTTNKALWTEEHNVVTEPGYMGWPFWTAAQKLQAVYPYNDSEGKTAWSGINAMNTAAPVNSFQGVGIPELPPAKPATYVYAHSCAMTGPIFRYDGRLTNSYQIPPHFNRIWFTTDFNRGRINAIRLDNAGKMVGDAVEIFTGLSQNFNKPIDFQQGPDGALYYLNYSCGTWRVADACTGIYRIEYKGTCKDPALTPEPPVAARNAWKQSTRHGLILDRKAKALAVSGAGYHRLEVYSVSGALVHSVQGMGSRSYPLERFLGGLPAGVYRARLVTEDGMVSLSLPHFGL
jgi:glucose/arabinose dehydrogenase